MNWLKRFLAGIWSGYMIKPVHYVLGGRRTITCPMCNGDGNLFGFFPVYVKGHTGPPAVTFACPRCLGAKHIPSDQLPWIVRGRRLQQYRHDAGLGLREAAELWGLKPSDLSRLEQGAVDNSVLSAGIPDITKPHEG